MLPAVNTLDLAASSVKDFLATYVPSSGSLETLEMLGAVKAADLASDICSLRTSSDIPFIPRDICETRPLMMMSQVSDHANDKDSFIWHRPIKNRVNTETISSLLQIDHHYNLTISPCPCPMTAMGCKVCTLLRPHPSHKSPALKCVQNTDEAWEVVLAPTERFTQPRLERGIVEQPLIIG